MLDISGVLALLLSGRRDMGDSALKLTPLEAEYPLCALAPDAIKNPRAGQPNLSLRKSTDQIATAGCSALTGSLLPANDVDAGYPISARKSYSAYTLTRSLIGLTTDHIVVITLVLIALQILDGVLTISGMHTFGVSSEGNPLLRELILRVGAIPAIVATKILCVGIVFGLYTQVNKINWLPLAMTVIAGVYAICAVIPWSLLLVAEIIAG